MLHISNNGYSFIHSLEVKYPSRDASLKDNWRGKYRADQYAPGEVNEIVIDAPEDHEDGQEGEEVPWGENALKMAIERGMSMWRSHTGKTIFK